MASGRPLPTAGRRPAKPTVLYQPLPTATADVRLRRTRPPWNPSVSEADISPFRGESLYNELDEIFFSPERGDVAGRQRGLTLSVTYHQQTTRRGTLPLRVKISIQQIGASQPQCAAGHASLWPNSCFMALCAASCTEGVLHYLSDRETVFAEPLGSGKTSCSDDNFIFVNLNL